MVANRLFLAIRKVFKPKRMGLVVHGFGVPHVHLIILPQQEASDIVSGRHAYVENGGIKVSEENLPLWPREKLDEIATRIKVALESDPNSRAGV